MEYISLVPFSFYHLFYIRAGTQRTPSYSVTPLTLVELYNFYNNWAKVSSDLYGSLHINRSIFLFCNCTIAVINNGPYRPIIRETLKTTLLILRVDNVSFRDPLKTLEVKITRYFL